MDEVWKAPADRTTSAQGHTQPDPPSFDDDLAATRPTPLVIVATLASLVAGVLAAATGFQLIVSIILPPWLVAVPYFMCLLGIAAAIVSVQLYRMKFWAAITMAALNGGLTFFAGGWALFALANGLVSLYGFLAPLISLGATVCVGLCVPTCRRAKEATTRLAAAD
jgi:hypothetical protein